MISVNRQELCIMKKYCKKQRGTHTNERCDVKQACSYIIVTFLRQELIDAALHKIIMYRSPQSIIIDCEDLGKIYA